MVLGIGWGIAAAALLGDTYWLTMGPMPTVLTRHAAVVVGSDFYILGGQLTTTSAPERSAATYRYDTLTGQWTTLAPMPAVAGTCVDGNGYAAADAAYLSGKIYLPSGYVGDNDSYCGVHMVYRITSNRWVTATAAPWPEPLGWAEVVAHQPLNGYFVVGGLTGEPLTAMANPSAALYFYGQGSGSGGDFWIQQPDMTIARYGHTTAFFDYKVCVAGGINVNNEALTQVECFDLNTNSWNAIPPLNLPRFNASSVVGPDGRWYVFGGTSPNVSSIAPIDVYDPATNSWTLLDAPFDLGIPNDPLRPPRAWLTGDFMGESLWVFGGEADTGSFNQGIPLSVIERILSLNTPPYRIYMPLLQKGQGD
jgi:hypothetical protein